MSGDSTANPRIASQPLGKSKLWQLACTLDQHDAARFTTFLQSPYHNSRPVMVTMWQQISMGLVDQGKATSSGLTKAALWQHLYPALPYRDQKLRHHMSELYALLSQFLVLEQLSTTDELPHLLLGERLLERSADSLFSFECNKATAHLAAKTVWLEDDLWLHYRWAQAQARSLVGTGRNSDAEIFAQFAGLDEWFVLQKLRQACSLMTRSNLLQKKQDVLTQIPLLRGVIELLESNHEHFLPITKLHYAAYCLLATPDPQHLTNLTQRLQVLEPAMPRSEVKTFYMLAINYAIRRLNDGHHEAIDQLYQLYEDGLRHEWLLEGGELSPWTFKNIVSIGIKSGKLVEIQAFVKKYKTKIPLANQYASEQQAYAEIFFAQRQFDKVISTLKFVHDSDPITHSRLRIMRIVAFYELDYQELLNSQLDNFERYLRDSKQSTYHQMRYRHFIKFVRQLAHTQIDNYGKWIELSRQLESMPELLERTWLIEKCMERAAQFRPSGLP